jgi:hypothetical protein
MRKYIFIFLLILKLDFFTQTSSFDFESITMIQQLPKSKELRDLLLWARGACEMNDRLDTLAYDFAVIMEHYGLQDSSAEIYELYFRSDGECVAHYEDGNQKQAKTFRDGELSLSYWQEYHKKHKRLEKEQRLYRIERHHNRRCQPARKLKEEHRQYVKSHYTVLTLIKKNDPRPQISIIYPPKKIFIFTVYKGGGKC